jgi:CubicO group peptidase (beta-lactamase class C family)
MTLERLAIFALSIAVTASIVGFPDFPPGIPAVPDVVIWRFVVAFLLPVAAITIWYLLAQLTPGAAMVQSRPPSPWRVIAPATAVFLSTFHIAMLVALLGAQWWLGRTLWLIAGVFLLATAAIVRSRRAQAVAGLLVLSCVSGRRAAAQEIPADRIRSLPTFVESTLPKLMDERHVLGAAVAVVHDGRVVLEHGYGKATLEASATVDPERTLFRVGSVTKVFTAAAAIQLAEAGRLDLHRDVREYLPDIPLASGATTHQLLTHTAGLLERFAGAATRVPEHRQLLSDHLQRFTPAQVTPPGTAYSYSNYNYALAGLVVERLSGQTYETYMRDRVFSPLKMSATVVQPARSELSMEVANGYQWRDSRHQRVASGFTHIGPAASLSTTASAMGRFMLAVLGDGSLDGGRILSPASVRMMLDPQYTPHPLILATTYGFAQLESHGRLLLYRGGSTGEQAAMVLLFPDARLGVFVASNSVPGIGDFLFEPLMTHLAGPAPRSAPPVPLPGAAQRAPRFAGTYRNYSRTENEMSQLRALMPMITSRVTVDADGALAWRGKRWVEVEPLLFRSVDGPDHIVLREDGRGGIAQLHAQGGTYERIGWHEQAPFHLALLASCLLAFFAYPLSRSWRALRRGRVSSEGRAARTCAIFVAVVNLTFVAGFMVFGRDLGSAIPLPLPELAWLALPLASLAVTSLLPAFVAIAWRERWWTRGERLGFAMFAALSIAFLTFLNYCKLLGVRY